jgi:hypothetical protein
MNAILISIFVVFPLIVMMFTLAMCKSASLADRNMELLRASDYKTKPIHSDHHELKKEFKGSVDEQAAARLDQSGAHS